MAAARSETETDIVRLDVNLNGATANAPKKLSEKLGSSLIEVVRRAISLYNFIDREQRSSHRTQTDHVKDGVVS